MKEDRDVIEFCRRAELDPNISLPMKRFIRMRFFEERPLYEIGVVMGAGHREMELMEEEILRQAREQARIQ